MRLRVEASSAPVSPSAIRPAGETWTPLGLMPFETPRELTADEIMGLVRQFRVAAANRRHAGLGGLELHPANGDPLDPVPPGGSNPGARQGARNLLGRDGVLLMLGG